jgi:hypothetical protein
MIVLVNPRTGEGVLSSLLMQASAPSKRPFNFDGECESQSVFSFTDNPNGGHRLTYSTPVPPDGISATFTNIGKSQAVLVASNIVARGQNNAPYSSLGRFLELNSEDFSSIMGTNAANAAGQDTDWRKEFPFGSIVNALTVRGEQFSIYGLGQSLKTVHGELEVDGEAYIQAVVERVEENTPSGGKQVYYRNLYYRLIK